MDQESFRKLLQTSEKPPGSSASSSAHVRGSLLTAAAASAGKKKQKTTVDASQPAFKPRTLKKGGKGEDYRDRASERRQGVNKDFAQVEALAEEFERRAAETEDREAVEEQRKYLGGDSQHTVLVKGLDFALLEQNRARMAAEAAVTEDVSLEEAFLESTAQPKKRTREDLLRELKSKRGVPAAVGEGAAPAAATLSAADKALEEAKKAGKFKPIGSKPVGGGGTSADGKVKRRKKVKVGEGEENGERKKKKRKVVGDSAQEPKPQEEEQAASTSQAVPVAEQTQALGPSTASSSKPPLEPEPEPVDEDFDIFAGAGEYTGIDLGDDDESDEDGANASQSRPRDEDGELRDEGASRPGKWLATSDDEREASRPPSLVRDTKSESRSMSPQRRSAAATHRPATPDEDGEVEEEERPVRLQPLASSALPSIKDLLAMSEEVEKADKRRARKEKKKAGGGGGSGETSGKDAKAKVERDYQRLKAYTDKKSKS